jgi:hypothetical protein
MWLDRAASSALTWEAQGMWLDRAASSALTWEAQGMWLDRRGELGSYVGPMSAAA